MVSTDKQANDFAAILAKFQNYEQRLESIEQACRESQERLNVLRDDEEKTRQRTQEMNAESERLRREAQEMRDSAKAAAEEMRSRAETDYNARVAEAERQAKAILDGIQDQIAESREVAHKYRADAQSAQDKRQEALKVLENVRAQCLEMSMRLQRL